MTKNPRSTAALALASLSVAAVAAGGTAYAADGGNLLLGRSNTATKSTSVSASSTSAVLSLDNPGNGPAASFSTKQTSAPFRVSSPKRVVNLNADRLDNLEATQFERSDATPVTASVSGATPVTASAASNVTLSADVEAYDPSGLHADGAATLVAPKAGTYVASAVVTWDAYEFGYRRSSIVASTGALVGTVAGPALPAPAYTAQNVNGIIHLDAGQAVRVEVLQGSGGPLGVQLTDLQLAYVSP